MASNQERTLTALEPYHVPLLHGSPILSLPPEIRFMIYRLLFTKHDVVKKPFEAGDGNKDRSYYSTDKHLAQIRDKSILLVCKLLHQEAMTVLYSIATLRIHLENNMQDQIANMSRLISPGIINTVTRVSINVQRGALADNLWAYKDRLLVSPESLRRVMDRFPALEELEITCRRLLQDNSRLDPPPTPAPMDYSELKKIPILVKPEYKRIYSLISNPSAYPRTQSVFKIEDDAVTFDEPVPIGSWDAVVSPRRFPRKWTRGALAPEHIFGADNRYLCPPKPKGEQPRSNTPDGDTKSGEGKLKE
ncbi:MAG: hypothetical protein Q9196_007041 [Gyalolechia fulgens]